MTYRNEYAKIIDFINTSLPTRLTNDQKRIYFDRAELNAVTKKVQRCAKWPDNSDDLSICSLVLDVRNGVVFAEDLSEIARRGQMMVQAAITNGVACAS